MKTFTFLIPLFFVLSNISAQQMEVVRDGLKNQTTTHQTNYQPDYMIQQFETGSPIEGDLVSGIDLSSDGTKLFVSHRHSGNVFVYDADTYDTIAVIKAARGIIDTHLTDSCLYLCCRDTRQLFIIDVTDYSIKNSFQINDDAIQVEVTADEELVLVGFSSFHDGWVTAYNANTGEVVYQTDEPMIDAYGLTNHIPGRTLPAYYSIDMSPKGDQFVARITDDFFRNYPGVFDASTGALIRTIKHETLRVSQYSETGDTLYILTSSQGVGTILRRIDCSDFSTIDSIITNVSFGLYLFQNMALYHNGSTVFIPSQSETGYIVFDFLSNSYQTFFVNLGQSFGDIKIEQSPDKRFVFIRHGWTNQVFDLETNELRGEFPARLTPGSRLCAAADGERLFVSKPGYVSRNHDELQEGVLVMDYSDPDDVFKETLLISAELPEADQPSSAIISRDGLKLYSLNTISTSLSIIDIASQSVDTIVDFPLLYEKITPVPKTDLIFLTGYGLKVSNSILFNPMLCEIVAEIDAPRTYAVQASPDGKYLFTITDTGYLRKIEVNGENSEVVIMKLVNMFQRCFDGWKNFLEIQEGTSSIFGISPDGKYILAGVYYGAQDESYIEVILTETLETAVKIPVENACVFDYVFTDDSKRVCVLSSDVDKPIIYLDSVNSYVENTLPSDRYMYSGQYNPSDSMFYLLNYRYDYWIVDPISGEVVDTVFVSDDYQPMWQLVFDEDDNVIIRRNSDLYHAGNFYELPAASRAFYFDIGYNTCVIPIPGPDVVCLFNPLYVGSPDGSIVKHHYNLKVYPNPAVHQITIDAKEDIFTGIDILDAQGKLVYSRNFNNFRTTIGTQNFSSGIYFIRVHFNKQVESRKLIIQ